MGVRSGREADSLLDREPDNFVGRIKFIHWFAPAGGGKFDRESAGSD
jgi:hypothetical protein